MIKRLAARFACNIDVLACTPIQTVSACIVDLSRHGAQLRLEPCFPKGAQIHLDVEGHYYWATVMWEEGDRMGIRFRGAVDGGPLDDALQGLTAPRAGMRAATAPMRAGFGRRVA